MSTKPQKDLLPVFKPTAEENKDQVNWFYVGKAITFKKKQIIEHLMKMGFLRYGIGGDDVYLHIVDKVVERIDVHKIADRFEDFIESIPEDVLEEAGVFYDHLINTYYDKINTFSNKNLLYRLRPKQPVCFQEHGKGVAYFYYKNGYTEVTPDSIELKPYTELSKYVWKDRILDRDFKQANFDNFSYTTFIKNLSGWRKKPSDRKKASDIYNIEYKSRFDVLKCIIGYSLHGYFETKLKTVSLTDSKLSLFGEPNGRSGKTLLVRSIGKMLDAGAKNKDTDQQDSRVFVEINGKEFSSFDKFMFQECKPESILISINDLKEDFDFKNMFNAVTDGTKVEQKGMMPFKIMAKIILISNHALKIRGESAEDRVIEYEIADYYSMDYSPGMEFNEWFFSDWNDEQWNMYDSFMIHCVQFYLKNGLTKPVPINLNMRKLHTETNPDFVSWMDKQLKAMNEGKDKREMYPRFDKKELRELFIADNEFVQSTGYNNKGDIKPKPWFNANMFTKWLKMYAKYKEEFKDYKDYRSNTIQWFQFIPSWYDKDDKPF